MKTFELYLFVLQEAATVLTESLFGSTYLTTVMADTNPSVIIIGAGPVGLYMAHAMERANIEYVLLDQKRSVSGSWGQLLFTWPHTVRLFDQIGVADKLKTVAFEMHQKKRVFGEDGHITSTNHFWDAMEHK